jgi:hypothetical protein
MTRSTSTPHALDSTAPGTGATSGTVTTASPLAARGHRVVLADRIATALPASSRDRAVTEFIPTPPAPAGHRAEEIAAARLAV